MKKLILFPRGSISAKDKKALTQNGYIVIQTPNPERVIMPVQTTKVTGDDLLMSALEAMNYNGISSVSDTRARFTTELTKRLQAREASPRK